MTEEIKSAIIDHPSRDVVVISKDMSKRFDKFIPPAMVNRVLSTVQRNENVSKAKSRASEALDDKVALMESVGQELLDKFHDKSLPMKERIEAAKELRQWTKMTIDAAGIHDKDNDKLFYIGDDWDPSPDAKN